MESITQKFLRITQHNPNKSLRFETDYDDSSGWFYNSEEKQLYQDRGESYDGIYVQIPDEELNNAIKDYRNYLQLQNN